MWNKRTPDYYLLLAPFYEFFSRKVFGVDFQQSKRTFIDQIQKGNTVLIVGGGTGAILPEILEQIGQFGRIIYLEASRSMLQRSQKNVPQPFSGQIQWIHSSRFEALPKVKSDVIISHYFLDVLTDAGIDQLFREVDRRIHPETKWFFTDFFPETHRKWLLYAMISSFRMLARHPRKDLPDYQVFFQKWGWKQMHRVAFQKGFFQAICYKPAPK